MFCKQCGANIPHGAVVCARCSTRVDSSQLANSKKTVDDKGGCLWMILGFIFSSSVFIPLLMFFVWKNERPLRAKSVLIGFLLGIIAVLVLLIILGIILGIGFSLGWFDDAVSAVGLSVRRLIR